MLHVLLACYFFMWQMSANRLDRLSHAIVVEERFEAVDVVLMEERWEVLAWRRDVFGDLQCFAIQGGNYPQLTGDPIIPTTLTNLTIDRACFPSETDGSLYFYDEWVWLRTEEINVTLAVTRKLVTDEIVYYPMRAVLYSAPDKPAHIDRGFKYPHNATLTPEQAKVFATLEIGFPD